MGLMASATCDSWGREPAVGKPGQIAGGVDPEMTYVLAIGCCVPWKKPQTCSNTVRLFVDAATAQLNIPHKNILTLIDKEATYEGVLRGFKWLSEKSSPDNAVIIYYNGHGAILPEGSGTGESEDVFVLWSEKFPFAGLYAVLAHIWMNDEKFSDLVDKLPGKAKLVIADTCHALEEWEDLHPGDAKIDYGLKDAALMAAALAGQPAVSTRNHALFTEQLVKAMYSNVDNLKEAFDLAQRETKKESRIFFRNLSKKTWGAACFEQGPTLEDPANILPLFILKDYVGKGAQQKSSHP